MRRALSLALAAAALAGCVRHRYYLAEAESSPRGEVHLTYCNGRPGGWGTTCIERDVPPAPFLAPDAVHEDLVRAVAREEAREPALPPRPAPDADELSRAITASGVPRLLAACRAAYAPDQARLRFAIAAAPDGTITAIEPHDVHGPFADCAVHALRATSVPAFDGAPVRYEEAVALSGP